MWHSVCLNVISWHRPSTAHENNFPFVSTFILGLVYLLFQFFVNIRAPDPVFALKNGTRDGAPLEVDKTEHIMSGGQP